MLQVLSHLLFNFYSISCWWHMGALKALCKFYLPLFPVCKQKQKVATKIYIQFFNVHLTQIYFHARVKNTA